MKSPSEAAIRVVDSFIAVNSPEKVEKLESLVRPEKTVIYFAKMIDLEFEFVLKHAYEFGFLAGKAENLFYKPQGFDDLFGGAV